MLDKLLNLFKNTELKETETETSTPAAKKPRKAKESKESAEQPSEKELATQRGDPYVTILRIDVDPNNINAGSFELDWNSKFVANLARAGYQMKPGESEDVIVDRWFKEICRNIVLEVFEQEMADPQNREMEDLKEELRHIRRTDLGNGRSEIS